MLNDLMDISIINISNVFDSDNVRIDRNRDGSVDIYDNDRNCLIISLSADLVNIISNN